MNNFKIRIKGNSFYVAEIQSFENVLFTFGPERALVFPPTALRAPNIVAAICGLSLDEVVVEVQPLPVPPHEPPVGTLHHTSGIPTRSFIGHAVQ